MSRPGSIACRRFRSREAAGVNFAVKADICRGEQAMGAVGRCVARLYRARCRGLSHGGDLASGDLIQIFSPSFASHSDRLRIFRATDLPAWILRLSHPEKRPHARYCGSNSQVLLGVVYEYLQ
jgi:hypothetical protein